MGQIRYSKGVTLNTGNFESVRIDLSLEDEPRGEETHAQAYNRIKDWVEARVLQDMEEERKANEGR